MRDPNRIEEFIAEFYELWTQHPDMRFIQMVQSLVKSGEDGFYLEDDEVLKRIKEQNQ